MNKFKAFLDHFPVGRMILMGISLFFLILFLFVSAYKQHMITSLSDQQAYKRWNENGTAAQVSAFFKKEISVDERQIESFRHQVEASLQEAAIVKENAGRLFVDAYSSLGKITVVSEMDSLEARAVGIGGDFFLFHQLKLVNGSYFSGNDLMKDSIIIDEEAAWKLFGSSDVAGMSVIIGGTPHYIAGVIQREKGRLAESAGLNESVVYVSHETLSAYGNCEGISSYELLAPNPVKGFAKGLLLEKFGFNETEMIVVENSTRFSMEALIPVILDFGIRSMQTSAVSYPYWENMARGCEDICAALLFLKITCLLIPAVIIVVVLWKSRKRIKEQIFELIKGINKKRRIIG